MAKKTDKRKIIGLVCEESGHRHYYTKKNTMNTLTNYVLKSIIQFSVNTHGMLKPRRTLVETKSSHVRGNILI